MNSVDIRHLAAVICLADKELARTDWLERGGALRTLLTESLPYLRETLQQAQAQANEVTA